MKPIAALSPSLERMLLVGMMRGDIPVDVVTKVELGREAQWLHLALSEFRKKHKTKPVTLQMLTTMAEEKGAEPELLRPFLKKMAGVEPAGARVILRAVHERQALVNVMNEASKQLADATYDPTAFAQVTRLDEEPDEDPSLYSSKEEPEIRGPSLGSMRRLTKATGGLMGFWVIAGDPGTGKSTLALQISSIAAGLHAWPVAYCDAENSKPVMRRRLQQQLTRKQFEQAAPRIEYVDMRHFTTAIPAWQQKHKRGLIVIDPLQKLPSRVDHKRESLEAWLRRFEEWAKDGYMVLALSEKDRASYGVSQSMKLGKETGEIEYSAWVGIQLTGGKTEDDPVNVSIVKNRHRPMKGPIVDLIRDEKRPFWFAEQRFSRDEDDE